MKTSLDSRAVGCGLVRDDRFRYGLTGYYDVLTPHGFVIVHTREKSAHMCAVTHFDFVYCGQLYMKFYWNWCCSSQRGMLTIAKRFAADCVRKHTAFAERTKLGSYTTTTASAEPQ